jgi:hypothetical protein
VSLSGIALTAKGIYGFSPFGIYKLVPERENFLKPVKIKVDSAYVQGYNVAIEDDQGNLIICGSKYLTAVIDGHRTMSVPINTQCR